ncbi:MAG: PTS ascorbate transporter subunit IIC [Turicibacter sp.]|nr:PTS ascorbate transporter subunit IIC [Turicibacter sp.]
MLDFIINDILREPAIFLGLIAFVGLLIQKKEFTDIISGTVKTIVGVVILDAGVGILVGSILPLAGAFGVVYEMPAEYSFAPEAMTYGMDTFLSTYGTQIGIVMLSAFLLNLVIARFTKWKNVFLTGHMLFWFPVVFLAVGINAGMSGNAVLIFAGIGTTLYMVVSMALIQPLVKKVTGSDSFTLGHPTVGLSLIAAYVGKLAGDTSKSTEDLKFPKQFEFLREITITSTLVILIAYVTIVIILTIQGHSAAEVLGAGNNVFMNVFMQSITFGAGLTIMLQGVRMMLAEIVPAFKGISDKVIPNAIPGLDCPLIFPYAPNAVIIGFIVSMVTSTLTLIIIGTTGAFSFVILPLIITCFFEIGTGAVFANATGGLRGAIIGSAVAGIAMMIFMGLSLPFFSDTIADWMLIFGGNDFSILGVLGGFIARIFGG